MGGVGIATEVGEYRVCPCHLAEAGSDGGSGCVWGLESSGLRPTRGFAGCLLGALFLHLQHCGCAMLIFGVLAEICQASAIFRLNVRMRGIWRYTNTSVLFGSLLCNFRMLLFFLRREHARPGKPAAPAGDGFNHPAHWRGR